jgi:DUF1365 family protein
VSRSAIYSGRISHHRAEAPSHSFGYRVWYALLDLDTISETAARIPLLGHNSFNLVSFYDRDHLGSGRRPVREKLASWLQDRQPSVPLGRVQLLTQLRVLGVVAEVNNTFGESYGYVLEAGPDRGVEGFDTDKVFHVSPFQPIDGRYRFHVGVPDDQLAVHIRTYRRDRAAFSARLSLDRRPFTTRALATTLARHPHTVFLTLALIHTQALRLWLKGAPFFPKPEPPAESWRTRDVHEPATLRTDSSGR